MSFQNTLALEWFSMDGNFLYRALFLVRRILRRSFRLLVAYRIPFDLGFSFFSLCILDREVPFKFFLSFVPLKSVLSVNFIDIRFFFIL